MYLGRQVSATELGPRYQADRIAGLLIIDLAVDDDLILGFLDLYHFAELGRGRSPNPGHGRRRLATVCI